MFESASNMSGKVDEVFLYITALAVAFLVFITAVMIYFVIRYSRKNSPKGEDIHGNVWLEAVWTGIPLVLFLSMFYFGWTNYRYMRTVPRDAMVIKVIGRQWAWAFIYPNGKQTSELYLALDRPVKLELESSDVVHGFFIPAFRVKQDVVPGKRNYTWFAPTQLGSYDIECTVICGVSHTYMLSKANVLPESNFKEWYFGDAAVPAPVVEAAPGPGQVAPTGRAERGAELVRAKGCLACHTTDGAKLVGPTWKSVYGKKETVISTEREVTVDEDYISRSIRDPQADIVKGYPASMPPQRVTDQDVRDITAYIKSLQ